MAWIDECQLVAPYALTSRVFSFDLSNHVELTLASLEFPGSVSLTSTETTDNIVSRFSTYRKGKNTATATALTKWLKMTQLADEKLIPKGQPWIKEKLFGFLLNVVTHW